MSIQKQGAVALGLFDGVHQGHRAVLQAAVRQKKNGLIPGAFTFHAEMSAMKNAPGYLYPTDLKIHILETECGMERIYAPPFEMVCEMSGEDFVREILCRRMNAAYAVCGNDFRFGKDARWDAEDLRRLGEKAGIAIEIVDDVRCGGEKVSSSAVRSLLLEGDIKHANLLLGAPYTIFGAVIHGAALGGSIGFPTINQIFRKGQIVPRYGVYAAEAQTPDGRWHRALTNIGMKPTVHYEGMPLAETHILGYEGDLYGQDVAVVLTKAIREERQFESVEALREQMEKDLGVVSQLSKSYHDTDT